MDLDESGEQTDLAFMEKTLCSWIQHFSTIEPTVRELSRQYNFDKQASEKSGTHLQPRKKKCGQSNDDLRNKKKLK